MRSEPDALRLAATQCTGRPVECEISQAHIEQELQPFFNLFNDLAADNLLAFGQAFFTSSAELGLRISQQLYLSSFFDVGNLWARARDFNPTRMFRGSGVGVALVTPLGPLGLDLGYGFDRVNAEGRRDPGWQVHFKFGQFF